MTSLTSSFSLKKAWTLLIPVVICLFVGFAANIFKSGSIKTWYPYLNKPALTPPNTVFPIVWTILYILMGLSIGLIYLSQTEEKRILRNLFTFQLILNFSWTILFFVKESPFMGLVCLILLDWIVILYMFRAWPVRKISTILFIPYITWLGFATYLNLYIYLYN